MHHVHLCICASMHLCIDASMHLCIDASMHLCIYASMHLCIYASIHLCIYASIYLSIYLSVEGIKAAQSATEDSSIYIYMYIYIGCARLILMGTGLEHPCVCCLIDWDGMRMSFIVVWGGSYQFESV